MSSTLDAAHKREVFFAGGEYTHIKVGEATKQYMINQIYVEKLTPSKQTQQHPIIFIAGAGQTGTNFLDTPDKRPGWAAFFLSHGYVVYITDQPSRGRSPWHPSIGSMVAFSTYEIETYFTATSKHTLWPQSKLHTQWPGSGTAGDPAFDAFFAANAPSQSDRYIAEDANAKSYSALLDRIGAAYLVTHSQSGAYGWRIADARPGLVKGIVAIEPAGPPFQSRFPFLAPWRKWGLTDCAITYEPTAGPDGKNMRTVTIPAKDKFHSDCIMQEEPAKKLINLVEVPVLVVTGEASYHNQYDHCTVQYLRQAGVNVEFADLGEEGIRGNGHLLFMEKNNLVIAERVLKWLEKH